MSRDPRTPKPDVLSDPARASKRAAQRVAALGEGWARRVSPPEGEVIWRESGDQVRLTPDGWLVNLNGGKAGLYASRLRATDELVAELQGESPKGSVIRPHKPVIRER